MPRKYIRKKETMYTLESLKEAVKEVNEKKITFRQAEEKYNIPKATLFDQIKKGKVSLPQKGKKPVFNKVQEEELVKLVINVCQTCFGITIPILRKIAFDFATANNINHKFNKDKGMAGMDWCYNFMARHPYISFRRAEANALFNPEDSKIFYDYLKIIILKHKSNLEEKERNKMQRKGKNTETTKKKDSNKNRKDCNTKS